MLIYHKLSAELILILNLNILASLFHSLVLIHKENKFAMSNTETFTDLLKPSATSDIADKQYVDSLTSLALNEDIVRGPA